MRRDSETESELEIIAPNAQDNRYTLSWTEFQKLCAELASKIDWTRFDSIFPILRGGLFPAVELSTISKLPIVWTPTDRSLIVDEISESGNALKPFVEKGFETAVVHIKNPSIQPTYYATKTSAWIVYPWESRKDIESIVERQIEFIGDDPLRDGVTDTPRRVVKSWRELFSGYNKNPKEILARRFPVERKRPEDSPVVLRDIEFYSTCEHHMLPFYGTVTVGYIPDSVVVGISKLARLVDCFARRLQIQERLCEQIADAIQEELAPRGVYVRAKAKHLCMIARGVRKQNAVMDSIAVRGDYSAIEKLI